MKKNVHYVVPFETYELLEEAQDAGQIIPDLSVFEKEIIWIIQAI